MAYELHGSGPPAIFIQGLGVHGGAWMPQIQALAAEYECLIYDNRGLGRSQPIGCQLSIEQMAEDTLALMDAQGWASAHLVGQSMGGLIALHTALSARHRVRSLAMLCSFSRGLDAIPRSPGMLWKWLRTRAGTKGQRRKALLELVMPEAALATIDRAELAARFAPIFGFDLAHHPSVAKRQLLALARYDATSRLHQLAGVPTLVISASHDYIAPSAIGRAMAAAIPGARFIEIPDASHAVAIQHSARVTTLLMEHFALS